MVHQAILNTLIYADIFDYPLTSSEIHKWLIKGQSQGLSLTELIEKNLIQKTKSYYHLPGRQNIVPLRLSRRHFSQLKLQKAKRIAKILSLIPSIRLITVTGALAMNNSDKNDDIDLMIITKNNRLWLTRLIVYLFFFTFFRQSSRVPNHQRSAAKRKTVRNLQQFKDKLCLNLWLDESALVIPKSRRNLYTAHEICQIKPLLDKKNTYQNFLSSNSWVKKYLPNATKLNGSELPAACSEAKGSSEPSALNLLNSLAFKLQHIYMKPKITNETISLNSAFFHPRPTAKIILSKYDKAGPCQQKTVLVTGCFDVLHQEHKNFLKKAKAAGDILIVGLESDARVKKLKGKDRPFYKLETRIKNLKKWGLADKVIALPEKFNKPHHHRTLIKKIKPDVLAVSSHTPNLPAKRKLMKSIGSIVKVVHPHNPKHSTSKLLKYSRFVTSNID